MSATATQNTRPLAELEQLVPAEQAHTHPVLGKIWRSSVAASSAAKRRHINGLAEAGAALKINHRLFFHPERTAVWAINRNA